MYSYNEWQELDGAQKYVKREIYPLSWDFKSTPVETTENMSNYLFYGCPFGGPLACVPNERSRGFEQYDYNEPKFLLFYSSSGQLLARGRWNHKHLIKCGWTGSEYFVCVLKDGSVHVYDINGEPYKTFDMFPGSDKRVADACFYDSGLVVRTTLDPKMQLWVIKDVCAEFPETIQLLHDFRGHKPPASLCLIPPRHARKHMLEVFLSTADGSIVVVDEHSSKDQGVGEGPFSRMVVSPDGTKVACLHEKGIVYVMSTDFKKNYSRCELQCIHQPVDMQWCGKDAVLVYWNQTSAGPNHTLVVLGSVGGGNFSYNFQSPIVIVPEIDGARIFSVDSCEYLEPIPRCCEAIFALYDTGDASNLFDAYEAYENQKAESHDYMQQIKGNGQLEKAFEDCCDAATYVWDMEMQKKLLKAAAHGKLFCAGSSPDVFVETCKNLRVINALRDPDIGIAVTYRQYVRISPEIVVNRLVKRKHHLLALSICKYLENLPNKSVVLENWAICKIRDADESVSNGELLDLVLRNLEPHKNVSYASIAMEISSLDRQDLAIALLECEPKAIKSVECLLGFRQYKRALDAALQSRDTDLVYRVVDGIMEDQDLSEDNQNHILKDCRYPEVATHMLLKYCQNERKDIRIKDYFELVINQKHRAGHISFEMAYDFYQKNGIEAMNKYLNEASRYYSEHKFEIKIIQEQKKLMAVQATQAPGCLADSLTNTILDLIRLNRPEKEQIAINLKNQFGVSDNRFYLYKCQILAEKGLWEALELLTKERPNNMNWSALVDLCIEHGEEKQAAKYAKRVGDFQTKIATLLVLGAYEEATEVAEADNNKEVLQWIYRKCSDPNLKKRIEQSGLFN